VTSYPSIKTENIHVKDDNTGKEYIIAKSKRADDSLYKVSIYDADLIGELTNKALCITKELYISNFNHKDVMAFHHGRKVSNNEISIDHINRVRYDNRLDNLRLASKKQQESNKGLRSDRREVIENLPDELDALPRFVRWDIKEKKYSFKDHPLVTVAERMKIPINTSSTKSETATLSEKMYDCLVNILDMFRIMRETDHEFDADGLSETRMQLGREYNEFVRFAHAHDPDTFPNLESDLVDIFDLSNYSYEEDYYESFLKALPKPDRVYHGPLTLEKNHMIIPGSMIGMCKKGNKTIFVWDLKHDEVMANVNIDADDFRIHITPQLISSFPRLREKNKKILCQDFIYYILEDRPWNEKSRIININQIREDIRTCNLLQIPCDNPQKSYKPPSTHLPILADVSLGTMKYLPRGVTTVNYARDPKNKFEMHVRPLSSYIHTDGNVPSFKENKAVKIVMSRDNAAQIFQSRVIPILENANDRFHENNAEYQKLLESYYESVTEFNSI